MIKRMGFFQRRADLTQTQFSAYWGKKHSPLVLAMPKFKRYTQNHRVDLLPNYLASHPAFELDGIAEMYWLSEAEMQADFDSQQGIDVLRQDETEFMSHISVCIAEAGVLQGETSALKLILSLSSADSGINETALKQALPHLRGIQSNTVKSVMNRPQLQSIQHMPQQFFTLWFDQYADVLKDFESEGWKHFYLQAFQFIERASLMLVYAFEVRQNECI